MVQERDDTPVLSPGVPPPGPGERAVMPDSVIEREPAGLAADAAANGAGPAGASAETRSLFDDLEALIDDGRTYLEAEFTYQKTRASFVTDKLKKTVAFAVVALVIAFLAAIGLTVGLIIALTPHVTGWGATAIVVGGMLLIAYLMVRRAGRNWNAMMGVIKENNPDAETGA